MPASITAATPLSFKDKISKAVHGAQYAASLAACAHKCAVETTAHESLAEHKDLITSVTGAAHDAGKTFNQFQQFVPNHPDAVSKDGGVIFLAGDDLKAFHEYQAMKGQYQSMKKNDTHSIVGGGTEIEEKRKNTLLALQENKLRYLAHKKWMDEAQTAEDEIEATPQMTKEEMFSEYLYLKSLKNGQKSFSFFKK